MSDKPPRREASLEDLERVPPGRVGEIVSGELHVSPRPAPLHARAAFRLSQALSPFDSSSGDEGPGGWVLLFEPELHLGKEALVPDLAGWRRERLPELPDTAALTLAPDWVCEGRWSRLGAYLGEARVRAEPFEAVELMLGRLWER